MSRPPQETWIASAAAYDRIRREGELPPGDRTIYPVLMEALADGDIRSRRVDRNEDYTIRRTTDLHPQFWHNDGMRRLDNLGQPTIEFEVHRQGLDAWLGSGGTGLGKGGRPPMHDWDMFWIEVVRLANGIDGLPKTRAAVADHIEDWFENEVGKSPSRSSIEAKVSRLYSALGLP